MQPAFSFAVFQHDDYLPLQGLTLETGACLFRSCLLLAALSSVAGVHLVLQSIRTETEVLGICSNEKGLSLQHFNCLDSFRLGWTQSGVFLRYSIGVLTRGAVGYDRIQ
jgi:hypothetical protein